MMTLCAASIAACSTATSNVPSVCWCAKSRTSNRVSFRKQVMNSSKNPDGTESGLPMSSRCFFTGNQHAHAACVHFYFPLNANCNPMDRLCRFGERVSSKKGRRDASVSKLTFPNPKANRACN